MKNTFFNKKYTFWKEHDEKLNYINYVNVFALFYRGEDQKICLKIGIQKLV